MNCMCVCVSVSVQIHVMGKPQVMCITYPQIKSKYSSNPPTYFQSHTDTHLACTHFIKRIYISYSTSKRPNNNNKKQSKTRTIHTVSKYESVPLIKCTFFFLLCSVLFHFFCYIFRPQNVSSTGQEKCRIAELHSHTVGPLCL